MLENQSSITLSVDASIFTESESIGWITGEISLPFLPQIGDTISFSHPEGVSRALLAGLPRVESRRFVANSNNNPAIGLSDIYVKTKVDGFRLLEYLEKSFGLFANLNSDEDLQIYLNWQQNSIEID